MTQPAYYYAPDKRCLFRLHASAAVTDAGDRLLLVQEAKPDCRGKWNLPGGHVDHGESIADAAKRETREETGLSVKINGLIGIYSRPISARFVFRTDSVNGEASAGDEILDLRWAPIEQVLQMDDDQLVSPQILKRIVRDVEKGCLFPLDLIASYNS
jgi:ADP-ribose pyrophosphatase YjhB (NUDIX family)